MIQKGEERFLSEVNSLVESKSTLVNSTDGIESDCIGCDDHLGERSMCESESYSSEETEGEIDDTITLFSSGLSIYRRSFNERVADCDINDSTSLWTFGDTSTLDTFESSERGSSFV